MLKRIFKTLIQSSAVEFGSTLANRLSILYPVSLDQPGSHKISANRMANILEGLYTEAQFFRHEHGLGYLGRTRLSHAFKWRLIELGYSREFIDMATEGLVVYLHRPLGTATQSQKSNKK